MVPSGCGRISITTEHGSGRDELVALLADPVPFLVDEAPEIRRLAVSVCAVDPDLHADRLRKAALEDSDASVRALAVEALRDDTLDLARNDDDSSVREAVATAYGELGEPGAVDWLIDRARYDDDRLVQEAAVAALGAIGDDRALPTLLALVKDGPPRVRRRAVVALTVFDDPAIEPAIRVAAKDRNPGVREAAEMVVGRESSERVISRQSSVIRKKGSED